MDKGLWQKAKLRENTHVFFKLGLKWATFLIWRRVWYMCREMGSPGKAWHSDWFWSHWQLRFNEQLLQLESLLQTCSLRTGHSRKFFTFYSAQGNKNEIKYLNYLVSISTSYIASVFLLTSSQESQATVYAMVAAHGVFLCELNTRINSVLMPPAGTLTVVQLLEAEMHFLSSHHWQPLVLAVQLAQSENR